MSIDYQFLSQAVSKHKECY